MQAAARHAASQYSGAEPRGSTGEANAADDAHDKRTLGFKMLPNDRKSRVGADADDEAEETVLDTRD